MLEIKRISNNIWKLIEKRQQLKVHLGKRKQDPDCHRSGKIRSLDKVLFKRKKEKEKGREEKNPGAWRHASGSREIWLGLLTQRSLPVLQRALLAVKSVQEGGPEEPEIPVVRKGSTCFGNIRKRTELSGDGFCN